MSSVEVAFESRIDGTTRPGTIQSVPRRDVLTRHISVILQTPRFIIVYL